MRLRFGDRAEVDLRAGAALELAGDAGGFGLRSGEAYASVTPGRGGFAIESPSGTARVLGTEFLLRVAAIAGRGTETTLTVARGAVAFANAGAEVTARACEQTAAVTGASPAVPIAARLEGLAAWRFGREPGPLGVAVYVPAVANAGRATAVEVRFTNGGGEPARLTGLDGQSAYLFLKVLGPRGVFFVPLRDPERLDRADGSAAEGLSGGAAAVELAAGETARAVYRLPTGVLPGAGDYVVTAMYGKDPTGDPRAWWGLAASEPAPVRVEE